MNSHTQVERILATVLYKILVGADTGSFQSFAGKLFVLIREQMNAKGEFIDVDLLPTKIENSNLRIGDTSTESRLRIRLVFTIPVAIKSFK